MWPTLREDLGELILSHGARLKCLELRIHICHTNFLLVANCEDLALLEKAREF